MEKYMRTDEELLFEARIIEMKIKCAQILLDGNVSIDEALDKINVNLSEEDTAALRALAIAVLLKECLDEIKNTHIDN
jgi:hypothetical protein